MDRLEQARKMFRELESQNVGHAAEVARRAFFVEANLNAMKK
jgi:hypothetical protein